MTNEPLMDSSAENSVTCWLDAVRSGEEEAAANLWDRYFNRLVRLARKRLTTDPGYDGEDLAVSVFKSLFRNLQDGRYELNDRDALWSLLVVFTMRKANDRWNRHSAQKRQRPGQDAVDASEAQDRELTPDLAVMMADQCQHLLEKLDDNELIRVAVLKLEGHSNAEIGEALNCSVRSVGRMLNLIRRIWEAEDKG